MVQGPGVDIPFVVDVSICDSAVGLYPDYMTEEILLQIVQHQAYALSSNTYVHTYVDVELVLIWTKVYGTEFEPDTST